MSSLPQKSIKGAVFKTWAISSIDKLIDYLSGTFIRGGKGIAVRRFAGVTIIELEKQPEQVQQNATGGGATQDISATVSGNTASIGLSGSTATVELVGTGDVTITGNTNGQIEFNATGGTPSGIGAPNYANPIVDRGSVALRTPYGNYANVAYLVGAVVSVIESVGGDDYLRGDVFADITIKGNTSSSRVYLASFDVPTTDASASISSPVFLIIPSGATVTLGSATDPVVSELAIYPSL